MLILVNHQIRQKGDDYVIVLVQHIHRIINNKRPSSWTEEEKRNPRVFDKQVQTYITMTLAVTKNKESAKVLSGGNFDYKDASGSGYYRELKYMDNDGAVKEVVRCIRGGCRFRCIPGRNSSSCFLNDEMVEETKKGKIM